MDRDKIDEAIEEIEKKIKKYNNVVENFSKCRHVVMGGINYETEIKKVNELKYLFVFMRQELTKIKEGHYIPKEGVLSEEEIIKILYKWEERFILCWNGEGRGEAFDCACCINEGSTKTNCNCICHKREQYLVKKITAELKNRLF